MRDTMGILEQLAERSGCQYLSDLPQPGRREQIRRSLSDLRPDQFPLREWNDAASYITRVPCAYATPEEAREALLRYSDGEE